MAHPVVWCLAHEWFPQSQSLLTFFVSGHSFKIGLPRNLYSARRCVADCGWGAGRMIRFAWVPYIVIQIYHQLLIRYHILSQELFNHNIPLEPVNHHVLVDKTCTIRRRAKIGTVIQSSLPPSCMIRYSQTWNMLGFHPTQLRVVDAILASKEVSSLHGGWGSLSLNVLRMSRPNSWWSDPHCEIPIEPAG